MRIFRPWFFIRWFYPGAFFRIRVRDKKLFLTFDDGPDPHVTPQIISILGNHGVKALFFCNGKMAEKNPDIITCLKGSGHLIGNHGYEHSDGLRTGREEYIRNVMQADSFTSARVFRPPYGRLKLSQFTELRKKYRIFFWDLMPYDFDKGLEPHSCLGILTSRIRPGSIIVLHDKAGSSAPAFLDEFIRNALSLGYEFCLPEL